MWPPVVDPSLWAFSPILAEQSPSKTDVVRTSDGGDDVVSVDTTATPDGPPLSSSPTSIAAVAPPPSPRSFARNYLVVSKRDTAVKAPLMKSGVTETWPHPANLEQRLHLLTLSSASSSSSATIQRVVVNGVAVVWTGELLVTTGLPTGIGKMFFPDGQVCKCS